MAQAIVNGLQKDSLLAVIIDEADLETVLESFRYEATE